LSWNFYSVFRRSNAAAACAYFLAFLIAVEEFGLSLVLYKPMINGLTVFIWKMMQDNRLTPHSNIVALSATPLPFH
jgi:ABC-type Fe3+ transport system permease subunit